MQQEYVELRADGLSRELAAKGAGYNVGSRSEVERNLKTRIIEELNKRGLDEDGMAEKYMEGLERVRTDKDFDGQAWAKLLLQVGYLRGHGKEGPQIAIQQNFGPKGSSENDVSRVEDLLRGIEGRLADIESEIAQRNADGLPGECIDVTGGSEILAEPQAHQGMVRPSDEPFEVGGGGKS